MTVMVNGLFMAGAMRAMNVAAVSFWLLDGVCGLLPAANSNQRVRLQ
jgi:hypothetical protein